MDGFIEVDAFFSPKKNKYKTRDSKKNTFKQNKKPIMLFRIYPNHTYSNVNRPRRNLKIPQRYWGFFVKCVEFPHGVVVDRNGTVQPLLKCSRTFPAYPLEQEYESSEDEGDEQFDDASASESDASQGSEDTETDDDGEEKAVLEETKKRKHSEVAVDSEQSKEPKLAQDISS